MSETRARVCVDGHGEVRINDHPVFNGSTAALLAEIETLVASGRPALVVPMNVDQILDLERLESTRRVYAAADMILMDGAPVVTLARLLGATRGHRHTGADLLPLVAAESAERGWRVAILGGGPGVAELAAARLAASHPGSVVRAFDFPFVTDVTDSALTSVKDELAAFEPAVVFICLGAPKQELWYLGWRDVLPPAVYVAAGAAVDFAAGTVARAPRWMQRLGAEWLWRLAQEPRRLARRYLLKGPRFVGVIARSLAHRDR
ncbi:MAG: WecB/TagA/CpsF family glycosyltransferase [Nocardioides sp.]|uniref:WecB/TagA/CpsF family glycosyltransferase n=1 Tax=Nocardioides sp. TaxID=35761 RepID=UPI0039E33F25